MFIVAVVTRVKFVIDIVTDTSPNRHFTSSVLFIEDTSPIDKLRQVFSL